MKALLSFTTDAALVRQALADRPDAFEELVLRYERKARAIARSIGVSPASLDDVVQESFLRTFRDLSALRTPASFGPWLLQIVRNLAREHVKRAGRVAGDRVPEKDLLDPNRRPDQAAEAKDFDEYLWGKVSELPEGIREAVFLYYHDGESTRAVSKTLAISRSAVKSRLQEGRDILRGKLWREMERCFREMLPREIDRRRKARRLTLVAMLTLPPGWAKGTTAWTTSASLGLELGALLMLKKIACFAVPILLAILGIIIVADPLGWRRPEDDVAKKTKVTRPAAAPPARPEHHEEVGGSPKPAKGTSNAGPVAISGTVFLGDEGGTLAPGAQVAVIPEGDRRQVASATVGPDGRYAIFGIPTGWYRVFAWKDAWAAEGHSLYTPLEVRAGTTTALDLVLVPGAIVGGRVVEARTGRSVFGAKVDLNGLRFATTDAEGRYRLEGVPAQRVGIAAVATAFAMEKLLVDLAPGEEARVDFRLEPGGSVDGIVFRPDGSPAAGAEVETRNGGLFASADGGGRYRIEGISIVERNLQMNARLGGLWGTAELGGFPEGQVRVELNIHLKPGIVLSGRVVDADGTPVPGASLWGGYDLHPMAASDEEGHFRIESHDSDVCLTVRKEGFARAERGFRLLQLLPERERENLEIVLDPGRSIEGTVVDREGKPISRAQVLVEVLLDTACDNSRTSWTDESGRFSFADLPSGPIAVGALKPGYAERGRQRVDPEGEVRIVLDEAGGIAGVVFEKVSGSPIEAFTVGVKPTPNLGGEVTFVGKTSPGIRFSSDDGRFAVRGLIVGLPYDLTVVADGRIEVALPGIRAWLLSEEREPLRVEVEPGKTLAGRVLDTAAGTPVAEARILHISGDQECLVREWSRSGGRDLTIRSAFTDEAGRFEVSGLRERPGALIIEKPGFGRGTFEGVLPGREVQTFGIETEAVLAGTVRTSTGKPVSGSRISVEIAGQGFPGAMADADGRFQIAGLPAGKAEVRAEVLGEDPHFLPPILATLAAGRTTVLDMVQPTGSIAGQVTLGGKPVGQPQIHIVWEEGNQDIGFFGGWDGRFRLQCLPPGRYRVEAGKATSSGCGPSRIVEVGDGETQADLEFSAGSLSGEVIDRATGRPVKGTSVTLLRQGPDEAFDPLLLAANWPRFDESSLGPGESRFVFEGLEPGRYFLVAKAGAPSRPIGTLGPLDLTDGIAIEGLALPTGGEGPIVVAALDFRTNAPIEKFSAALHLEGGRNFLASLNGTSGKGVFEGVVPGSYILEVDAEDFIPVVKELKFDGIPLTRTVLLEPASWIVVRLVGDASYLQAHNLAAVALVGGDPGWTFRTIDGGRPMEISGALTGSSPTAFRFKARPGRYRLRLDLAGSFSWDPPQLSREVEVQVPANGEASIDLTAP